jgi:hypothetical protein
MKITGPADTLNYSLLGYLIASFQCYCSNRIDRTVTTEVGDIEDMDDRENYTGSRRYMEGPGHECV